MKAFFLNLSGRIDAMTLRERVMLFAGSIAAVVFVLYALLLDPLFAKQKSLRAQVGQNQNNIGGIDNEITQKVQSFALEPDAPNRARLASVKAEIARLDASLRAVQKGLVSPEKMAPLLETILNANGRLRLLSMRTLPVSPLDEGRIDPAPAAAGLPVAAAAGKPHHLLYRHGVELTVRGNYLDMVNYMSALEAMPTQLFWGNAALAVEEYPNARLTLTVYTLSLDQKWMKL